MTYTYPYPRPMVTADIILFSQSNSQTEVLLIERLNNPFKDTWALPGGFMNENESPNVCAKRELFEETGVLVENLQQFRAFGDCGRDPRGHSISIVHYQFVDKNLLELNYGDDAKNAAWFNINNRPTLAFDHDKILNEAVLELLV